MNENQNENNENIGNIEAEETEESSIADIENSDTEIEEDADEEDKTEKRGIAEEIFEWVEIFSSALVTVILLFTFVFRLVTVEGSSMEKTLYEKDNLIISHMFYEPKPNDIVVIQVPNWWNKVPIIKRVIAVEGQTVDFDFENWKVIVDGVPIDEPYVNKENGVSMNSYYTNEIYNLPLTVEKGKVFVLGDNRNHSADSRHIDIRQVDVGNVMGRVLIRVYPFNKLGIVKPNGE